MAKIIPYPRKATTVEIARKEYEEADQHHEAVLRHFDARCPSAIERFRKSINRRNAALAGLLEAKRQAFWATQSADGSGGSAEVS